MRRAMMLLLAVLSSPLVLAGTVYKCSDGHGNVSYQQQRCAGSMTQETLQLPSTVVAPATTTPAPAPASAPTPAEQPVAAPASPRVPMTQMYQCLHAVDGTPYVSSDGHPRPFLAPLGMLGALPNTLSQSYGSRGGAGISAPEANRGRVGAGLVAGSYTQVQDSCRPMSVPEICRWLRDQDEENARKLRRAFKSDQKPLLKREAELRTQLTHCRL